MIQFANSLCLDDIKGNHLVCVHAASVTGNSATNGHVLTPYNVVYAEMLTQLHSVGGVMITNHPSVTIIATSWNTNDAARGGAGQIVCLSAPCHLSSVHWCVNTCVSGNFYWFTTNTSRRFKEYKHFDASEIDLLCRHVDLFNVSVLGMSDDGCSSADTLKTQATASSNASDDTVVYAPKRLLRHEESNNDAKYELFIDKLRASILNFVNTEHPTQLAQKGNEIVYSQQLDEATCTSISTGILLVLKSSLLEAYDSMCVDNSLLVYIDATHSLFPGIENHDTHTKQSYRLKLLQLGQFKKGLNVDKGMCKKVTSLMRTESLMVGIHLFVQRCMCDMYVGNNEPDARTGKKITPWIMWRDLNASLVTAINTFLFTDTNGST
jgi:hypothetical protein